MSVLLWKADVGAANVLLVNIKQSAIFTALASLCIVMLYLAYMEVTVPLLVERIRYRRQGVVIGRVDEHGKPLFGLGPQWSAVLFVGLALAVGYAIHKRNVPAVTGRAGRWPLPGTRERGSRRMMPERGSPCVSRRPVTYRGCGFTRELRGRDDVAARDRTAGEASGRRRADGSHSENPRDEIIRAAARLFVEQGYASTTMTSIARAAGLRQPSVYYWFRNKEEVLHATASINRFSASVVAALRESGASAPEKLYRLLYEDTKHICLLGPLDYHQVEAVAYQRPAEFREFWADYRALFDGIVELIQLAIASGAFRKTDPAVAGAAALSLNEGLQKLHRYRAGPGGDLGLPVPVPALDDADAVSHQSAATTLASLLEDSRLLESVRAGAMAIRLEVDREDPGPRLGRQTAQVPRRFSAAATGRAPASPVAPAVPHATRTCPPHSAPCGIAGAG